MDPAFNLAFEEYVLTHRKEGVYLLLWQNDNTIVIGQNQNAEAEINRSFVEEHNIRVVRRSTGGGAVYHDLGNLNYSFITDVGNAEELAMERFTYPVVKALKALGLSAETSERNDILIDGKKVSGTAQRVARTRILHHGTLLFDTNCAMVAGALNVDPEKFRSKSVKSVRSRIGNIRSYLRTDMDLQPFWMYLKGALTGCSLCETTLTSQELDAVWNLKTEKYDTWEWTYGRSPQYNLMNKHYWPGGCLEVRADVDHGIITDLVFYGDFLAVKNMDPITNSLRGCAFRVEDFGHLLDQFDLPAFFGAITKEEILKTVFYASSTD